MNKDKRIEVDRQKYPDAKVGDVVIVNKYLSRGEKMVIRGIIYGQKPSNVRGHGKYIISELEILEPKTVIVSKVSK